MTLSNNILLIFSIAFFVFCIVLILHLCVLSPNSTIIKTIFLYILIYEGSIAIEYIFRHKNEPNFGISLGHTIGAIIGSVAGLYLGYQIFILSGIFDIKNSDVVGMREPTAITFTLSWLMAEIGRLIGGILGNVLLPV